LHEFVRKPRFRGRKLQIFDFGRFGAISRNSAQAGTTFEAIKRKFAPKAGPRGKITIAKNSMKMPDGKWQGLKQGNRNHALGSKG